MTPPRRPPRTSVAQAWWSADRCWTWPALAPGGFATARPFQWALQNRSASAFGIGFLREEQPPDFQGDGGKRCDGGGGCVVPGAELEPATVPQLQGFEGASFWIDDPVEGDAVLGVERPFGDAIDLLAAGREDLTDPVGSDPDGALAAGLRQPLPSPASEIWPDHVVGSELHVDLDENPPPAWAAAAVIIVERPAHEAADRPLRFGVSWQGRWRRGDLTPDDFPSDVVRKTQQVFVGA